MAPRGTYRTIADDIRRSIQRGEMPAGALVPSELSMAEERSVSRGTVRAALAMLADEGLIEVVPGQGRRVVGTTVGHLSSTAWAAVAEALRQRLASGDMQAGAPLPSEAALVREFEVSRNTVRRAYRQLVDEGLVVIRHGAGAFPAPR